MSVSISSEKTVTPEYIVAEASAIWAEMRKSGIKLGDLEAGDEFMAKMRKAHPEFAKSYPVVLRYICQMQEYSPVILKRWLRKINVKPWLNEKEYYAAQADYVVMLYKNAHPNARKANVRQLRANVQRILEDEAEQFKSVAKSAESEVLALERALLQKTRRELAEFVAVAHDTIGPLAGTIRVETEVDTSDLPQIGPAVVELTGRACSLLD